jgi:hypothetical protein
MLMLKTKHILIVSAIGFSLAGAAVPLFAEADTQTADTAIALTVSPVIITFSTSASVTLGTIVPDATGRESISSDTISATTNDGAGMFITMNAKAAANTSLAAGAATIASTAGTTAAPIALTNNTWGFRVDSLAGFGAGPTSPATNIAPSAATFAAIPATASPYTIKTTATNGSANQTVYYGVRVSSAQVSGNYSSTVTYTFTTN